MNVEHTNTPIGMVKVNPIRVVHLFNKRTGKGGLTIGYMPVIRDAVGNPRGIFARVAVAYCRPDERYSRKIGAARVEDLISLGQNILVPIYCTPHPTKTLIAMFGDFIE